METRLQTKVTDQNRLDFFKSVYTQLVKSKDQLVQLNKDEYQVNYTSSDGSSKYVRLRGVSFHAMGKRDLGAIVANPL